MEFDPDQCQQRWELAGHRADRSIGALQLSDVPAASLYRHVARLVDGGVLSVVAERRVRGAVERTYVLRTAAASVSPDELAKMTPDQHQQMFLATLQKATSTSSAME